jgi:superfamily II DNA/RNA helicase
LTALLAEISAVPATDATFASLGVPAPLVTVLDGDGIAAPFPIQSAVLPDALAGRDILGRAKTGSGKTLGFSLPMVARLAGAATAAGRPRGLVLVPTRELATQVQLVLTPLAHAMGLRVATVYGGVSYRPQINALQRRTDVLVACPGRLADLIGQGHCDLGGVEVTVIDEADQMTDLGFLPIVRRLLEATPDDGQRMLFSATLDGAIDVLARRFLNDPAHHWVDSNSSPAEIEHHVITIHPAHRLEVITALAGGEKRSLVFTRTKHGAERLARQLTAAGIPAAELHGNLTQAARARNLAAFGSGAVRVMVATDIAARGIHVDGIDLVIHADPPAEHKAYVHRSGRTARGGADGVVVTMQTKAQARDVGKLMRGAGVTPHQADAAPDSAVLREIAGPPVPRVTLAVKVTELVRPEERLTASGRPGHGRPGDGRTDAGRPRGRKPRAKHAAGADRDERSHRDGRRPARSDRRDGFAGRDRFDRRERSDGGERPGPSGRPGRPGRFDRAERAGGDERGRGEWTPSRRPRGERGAGGRPQGTGRPAGTGGNWGGATARPGYSGSRTTPGNRRNPGQGRHS